jgi:hypothetical protein
MDARKETVDEAIWVVLRLLPRVLDLSRRGGRGRGSQHSRRRRRHEVADNARRRVGRRIGMIIGSRALVVEQDLEFVRNSPQTNCRIAAGLENSM